VSTTEKNSESDGASTFTEVQGLDRLSRPGIKPSIYSLASPKGNIGFLFSGIEDVVPYELDDFRSLLIRLLDGQKTVTEIIERMKMKNAAWDAGRVEKELSFLQTKGILEPDIRYFEKPKSSQTERYERQLIFFGTRSQDGRKGALEYQRQLEKARVVVCGLGGFGSHILTGLAYMGIGNITVVDFDTVEASNLNRQILYDETDLGKKKIEVALDKCMLVNSRINYDIYDRKITGPGDFREIIKGADLVVQTADSPRQKIFYWLNEVIHEMKIPALFTLGATPDSVIIGPLVVPGQTACFACTLPKTKFDAEKEPAAWLNRKYRHGTMEPYIMTGVGFMLNEIVNHFTGICACRLKGAILHINMHTYETRINRVASIPGCSFCSDS
jgi:molybdopterin-synthase adenylyltransferase